MNKYEKLLQSTIDNWKYVQGLSDADIKDIMAKYDILASALLPTSSSTYSQDVAQDIITKNKKTFRTLLNKEYYYSIMLTARSKSEILSNDALNTVYTRVGGTSKKLYVQLLNSYTKLNNGVNDVYSDITPDKFKESLALFGLKRVDNSDDLDDQLNAAEMSKEDLEAFGVFADQDEISKKLDETQQALDADDDDGAGETAEDFNKPFSLDDFDNLETEENSGETKESEENTSADDDENFGNLEDEKDAAAHVEEYTGKDADDEIDISEDKYSNNDKESEAEEVKSVEERQKEADEIKSNEELRAKTGNYAGTITDYTIDLIKDSKAFKAGYLNDENLGPTVQKILDKLGSLYSDSYINPPFAVLGMYGEENNIDAIEVVKCTRSGSDSEEMEIHVSTKYKLSCKNIYRVISSLDGNIRTLPYNEAIKKNPDYISWMMPNGDMKYNYSPSMQARIAFGVYEVTKDKRKPNLVGKLVKAKSWSSFRKNFEPNLINTMACLLSRIDGKNDEEFDANFARGRQSVYEFYTNTILINSIDAEDSLKYAVSLGGLKNKGLLNRRLSEALINADVMGLQTTKSYEVTGDAEADDCDVYHGLIILDEEKFNGSVNFAYKTVGKAVEHGANVKLSSAIIGTTFDGKSADINLNSNKLITLGICAGSRSGKGVLTMALMAQMLAAGAPVCYIDYKPDMAGELWNIQKKLKLNYPENGIYAIDGKMGESEDATPPYPYTFGYMKDDTFKQWIQKYYAEVVSKPGGMDEIKPLFKYMPYIKSIYLADALGAARLSQRKDEVSSFNGSEYVKVFFILDEAETMSESLQGDLSTLKKSDIMKASNPLFKVSKSDKTPDGPLADTGLQKYFAGVINYYEHASNALNSIQNTTGGKGDVAIIVIGQRPDAGDWDGPLKGAFLNKSASLFGVGADTGNKYGMTKNDPDLPYSDRMGNTGVFTYSPGRYYSASASKVIKTAMVLNDNDINLSEPNKSGTYVRGLLKNLKGKIYDYTVTHDLTVDANNTMAQEMGYQVGQVNPLAGFPGYTNYLMRHTGNITDFEGHPLTFENALTSGRRLCTKYLKAIGIIAPGRYSCIEEWLYSVDPDSLINSDAMTEAFKEHRSVYDSGANINEINNNYSTEEQNDRVVPSFYQNNKETEQASEQDDRMSDAEIYEAAENFMLQVEQSINQTAREPLRTNLIKIIVETFRDWGM